MKYKHFKQALLFKVGSDVKMLRRIKIMLHVIRGKNYWLLIIKYI